MNHYNLKLLAIVLALQVFFVVDYIQAQSPINSNSNSNANNPIGTTTEINGGLIVKGQNQLFLQSPGGLCWALKVNDSGVLETEAVLCDSFTSISVTISNTDSYQYVIPIGDEEGAGIHTQANHYLQSEIINDVSTNWQSTYFYKPQIGFTGEDKVVLAIETGSDGAGPNTHIEYLTINFTVVE